MKRPLGRHATAHETVLDPSIENIYPLHRTKQDVLNKADMIEIEHKQKQVNQQDTFKEMFWVEH